MRGFSLLDLLAAMTIILIVIAAAVPLAHNTIDRSHTWAAATYVSGRIATARFEAVKRSASVAIQFSQRSDGYWLRTFVDGNQNGVLARDIASGADPPLTPDERLDHRFAGVEFGIHPGVVDPDLNRELDPGDPIHLGRSTLLSVSPQGSATSGTVFIRGRQRTQFAVRILGATGRTRVLRYNFGDRQWQTR